MVLPAQLALSTRPNIETDIGPTSFRLSITFYLWNRGSLLYRPLA